MLGKIIIATGNKGKYDEFAKIIREASSGNFAEEIIFAPDISRMVVEETGKTYAENAMLKARAWAENSGQPCLADDSGLEVDALDGAPGLYSARVVAGNDSNHSAWLLSQLEGVVNRKARFVVALCLCVPGEYTLITEGYCYGSISETARGDKGFGYDPVFMPEGYNLTFAELVSLVKNQISHRAEAFRKIHALLGKET
ncbi:MAG: RdgB/HAM1 family non-canonical purine NTP pyrophosphatase [Synergistaceae bacterium]|nr:RdgB/HAM1 family non-canonical purine NTP pyrophosphatase [Synergistaceae bacterium]